MSCLRMSCWVRCLGESFLVCGGFDESFVRIFLHESVNVVQSRVKHKPRFVFDFFPDPFQGLGVDIDLVLGFGADKCAKKITIDAANNQIKRVKEKVDYIS